LLIFESFELIFFDALVATSYVIEVYYISMVYQNFIFTWIKVTSLVFFYFFQQPTRHGRTWLVHPFGNNPWWSAVLAVVPAFLATILVFMDQQITVVIVSRKENKLKVRDVCSKCRNRSSALQI